MATGKSHGICNEMQGILSKHSSVCLCPPPHRMVPLWRNMHNFTLFYKKLIEVIQNVIFAWGDLTRSIISIGTNIEKKRLLNVLLRFALIKTVKPYK